MPVRKPRRQIRGLLRVGVIAAALIVLLAGVTVAAGAMGYNLWGWIPKWTDEDVRFVAETPVQEPDEDDLQDIPTVLAMMGISEPLYPNWLPEDFIRTDSSVFTDPFLLTERFQGDNRELIITITPISGSETTVYQKKNNSSSEYLSGNTMHYIFYNTNNIQAIWFTENYSVLIDGDITQDEIKRIIDSTYEVMK